MLFCLLHRSNRLSCFAHRVCNVHASIAFRSAIFFHFDNVRVASAVFISREKEIDVGVKNDAKKQEGDSSTEKKKKKTQKKSRNVWKYACCVHCARDESTKISARGAVKETERKNLLFLLLFLFCKLAIRSSSHCYNFRILHLNKLCAYRSWHNTMCPSIHPCCAFMHGTISAYAMWVHCPYAVYSLLVLWCFLFIIIDAISLRLLYCWSTFHVWHII